MSISGSLGCRCRCRESLITDAYIHLFSSVSQEEILDEVLPSPFAFWNHCLQDLRDGGDEIQHDEHEDHEIHPFNRNVSRNEVGRRQRRRRQLISNPHFPSFLPTQPHLRLSTPVLFTRLEESRLFKDDESQGFTPDLSTLGALAKERFDQPEVDVGAEEHLGARLEQWGRSSC